MILNYTWISQYYGQNSGLPVWFWSAHFLSISSRKTAHYSFYQYIALKKISFMQPSQSARNFGAIFNSTTLFVIWYHSMSWKGFKLIRMLPPASWLHTPVDTITPLQFCPIYTGFLFRNALNLCYRLLLTFKGLPQHSPTYIQDLVFRHTQSRNIRAGSRQKFLSCNFFGVTNEIMVRWK